MTKRKTNLKDIITPMEFFKLRGQQTAIEKLPLEKEAA